MIDIDIACMLSAWREISEIWREKLIVTELSLPVAIPSGDCEPVSLIAPCVYALVPLFDARARIAWHLTKGKGRRYWQTVHLANSQELNLKDVWNVGQ